MASTPTSTAAAAAPEADLDTVAVTFQLLSGADVVLRFPRACTNARAIEIIDASSSSLDSSCVFVDAASGRRLPPLRQLPACELCDFFTRGDVVMLALLAPRTPPKRVRQQQQQQQQQQQSRRRNGNNEPEGGEGDGDGDGDGDDDDDDNDEAVFRYRPPSNRLLRSVVEEIRRRRLLPDPFIAVVLKIPRKVWLFLVLWPLAAKVSSLLGVGPPFILLSIVAAIATNLGKRKPGEASAYTIFNDFKPLLGEFRAEQVDAGLRRGNL